MRSQAVRSLENIEDVSDELSNHSGNAVTDMPNSEEHFVAGQNSNSAHQHQMKSDLSSSTAQVDQTERKKVR